MSNKYDSVPFGMDGFDGFVYLTKRITVCACTMANANANDRQNAQQLKELVNELYVCVVCVYVYVCLFALWRLRLQNITNEDDDAVDDVEKPLKQKKRSENQTEKEKLCDICLVWFIAVSVI